MKTFEIWSEGYKATGQSSDASLLDTITANSFDEAVAIYIAKTSEMKEYYHHSGGKHFIWGCQLFDNGQAARKSFG